MATVEKIVANPATNSIILVLESGNVVPYSFSIWAAKADLSGIKADFQEEANGSVSLDHYGQLSYDFYSDEIEHPAAVIVYTKEKGWLI